MKNKLYKKNQLLILLILMISGNSQALLPDRVDQIITPWEYVGCDGINNYRGFDQEDQALAKALEYHEQRSVGCMGPMLVSEEPWVDENAFNYQEYRLGCPHSGYYPEYGNQVYVGGEPYDALAIKNQMTQLYSYEYYSTVHSQCMPTEGHVGIQKHRQISCPEGYVGGFDNINLEYVCGLAYNPQGDSCAAKGGTNTRKPINTATGSKFHRVHIDIFDDLPLSLYYSSATALQVRGKLAEVTLGQGWKHIYTNKIISNFKVNGNDSVFVRRNDGKLIHFSLIGGQWVNESKTHEVLTKNGSQWLLVNEHGETETYNSLGKLVNVSNKGNTISLYYESGDFQNDEKLRLSRIGLESGQFIDFNYNDGTTIIIDSINDSLGRVWDFLYTSVNLTGINYPDNTTLTYHYEDNNHPFAMTGITDRNGNRYATYNYDSAGRVIYEEHDGGIEALSISYGANNIRTITNSRGKISTYEVEENNGLWQIKSITGPGCSSCGAEDVSFEYDQSTNDILSKTQNGITTKYGNYDAKGQYGYKIEAFGTSEQRQIDYTWDPRFFKKPLTITEDSVFASGDKVTTYSYDSHGNILSMTESGYKVDGTTVSATTSYQYNGPLNQISQIDGPRTDVSDITTFEYYLNDPSEGNNRGRLKKVTNAAGHVIRDNIQYTSTGKVLSEDKLNGLSTSYTYYAGNDRLQTTTTMDGVKSLVTHMSYLNSGEITSITRNYGTAEASTMSLTYDTARRLIRVTDDLGNYVHYTLDTEGNQEAEDTYDPSGVLKKTITQVFDDYDQVDTSTQSGVTNDLNYGSDGNIYEQINGRGVKTEYDYDSLNRLTQIIQDSVSVGGSTPMNVTTAFEYDANDRVNKVTDANNHNTLYEYDDLGRMTQLISPDTGTTIYTHDTAGNVTGKTDANGNTTTFTYDALNRPLSIDYVGTDLDATFVYDVGVNGLNQLTSFSDSKSSTSFTYDAFGNLLSKAQTVNSVAGSGNVITNVSYSYDNYNRLSTMTYPSGVVLSYNYNDLNQIEAINAVVNGSSVNVVDQIQYLPMGPISSMNYGGTLLDYTAGYNNGYRLNNFYYKLSGTTVYKGTYSYDNNHNITKINDGSGGVEIKSMNKSIQDFTYDHLDRLTSEDPNASVFNTVWNYSYDDLGNRLSVGKTANVPIIYSYDANSNRLLSVDNETRSYDANGNILSTDSGDFRYTYNGANRMSAFKLKNKVKAEYIYNGIGQRLLKIQQLPKNKQAYQVYTYNSEGQLLSESVFDDGGVLLQTKETLWLNSRPVAQVRSDYDGNNNTTSQNIYYILTDHLNTPRNVVDISGTLIWSWNSRAFGEDLANEDVDGDGQAFEFHLRFPGQYFDKESGQHYNYFRDYEPATGRYLQSDPIGLRGGWNTFAYVGGNPIGMFDLLGLKECEICNDAFNSCYKKLKKMPELSSYLDGGWGMKSGCDKKSLIFRFGRWNPTYRVPDNFVSDFNENFLVGFASGWAGACLAGACGASTAGAAASYFAGLSHSGMQHFSNWFNATYSPNERRVIWLYNQELTKCLRNKFGGINE